MTEQQNTTARNKLRLKLLSQGYTPLPLLDKGIYIKGWSTVPVDEPWLEQYERNARYLNTGLRCDRLIAFDIDAVDEDLADLIDETIGKMIGRTELCRYGAKPRRLLLYRLKGALGKSLRTGKYGDHRVELLCGPGRQFAAYGQHPSGCAYEWDGTDGPVEMPLAELPACTYEQAVSVIEACERILQETGLDKQRNGYAHELREHPEEFDLTDDFEILLAEGRETTWGELKGTLDRGGIFGNIKRADGEYGDSNGIHFMLAEGSNQPGAYDFVRDVMHWEPIFQPQKLAEVLPPLDSYESGKSMFTPDPYRDLLDNWVYMSDGEVRHIGLPQRSYNLGTWRVGKQHINIIDPNKPLAKKTEPAVKVWLRDPNTMRADYAAMRPDQSQRIITDGPATVLNTYAPPRHPTQGGEVETVCDFIEHLVPDPVERDLFLDWHALKLVHPHWRMHGLIMVAETFGTGRGTWTEILQRLFGVAYVRSRELGDLIGGGSQSAYNAYLSDSLIVSVPEALEENESLHGWAARHAAYERIKAIVEPQATIAHIKRKFGRNSDENVYASFLIATNHVDALAIERGDRRLIVLENGVIPLIDAPDGLQYRIHEWKLDAANIGALERMLRERAKTATYRPFGEPMMTPAKEKMIEIGRSAIDQAYEYMLDNAPGDVVTHRQWLQWVERAKRDLDLNIPRRETIDTALTKTIERRAWRIKTLPKSGQIKVKGNLVRPWIIRHRSRWESNTPRAEIAAELLKNGDPRGSNVQPLPEPKK